MSLVFVFVSFCFNISSSDVLSSFSLCRLALVFIVLALDCTCVLSDLDIVRLLWLKFLFILARGGGFGRKKLNVCKNCQGV